MKKESVIKTSITPHFSLLIDKEDGSEPITWKLCLDYNAIARIEDAIGKDLKKIEDWKDISSGKDFPQIVWGSLHRYNPDVTLDEVKDMLNPECQRLLSDALFEMAFPGVSEAYQKALAAEKETGETADPNEQTATQST